MRARLRQVLDDFERDDEVERRGGKAQGREVSRVHGRPGLTQQPQAGRRNLGRVDGPAASQRHARERAAAGADLEKPSSADLAFRLGEPFLVPAIWCRGDLGIVVVEVVLGGGIEGDRDSRDESAIAASEQSQVFTRREDARGSAAEPAGQGRLCRHRAGDGLVHAARVPVRPAEPATPVVSQHPSRLAPHVAPIRIVAAEPAPEPEHADAQQRRADAGRRHQRASQRAPASAR